MHDNPTVDGQKSPDDLWKRFKRGNREAFLEVAETYQNMVFGLAFKMCGNRHQAEDITQEVFVRIFEKHHTFKGKSELSTWIYRITVNVTRTHFRKNSYYSTLIESGDENGLEIASDNPSPEEETAGLQLNKAITAALKELSAKNREAFVLKHLQGLSYEEIEEILQVPVSRLKMRVHRAREQLKDQLEKFL